VAAPGIDGVNCMSSPSIAPAIGPNDFRLIRISRGHSLASAAEKVGIDPSELSRIERNLRPLPPDTEVKLLRLYFGQRASR
jgi:hypothetical protein